MIFRLFIAASGIFMLASCATKSISPQAANVQVHRDVSTMLSDCKKLGPVTGTGSKPLGNAVGSEGAIQEAIGDIREATYAISGDSVALVNQEISLTSVRVLGVAYKCF